VTPEPPTDKPVIAHAAADPATDHSAVSGHTDLPGEQPVMNHLTDAVDTSVSATDISAPEVFEPDVPPAAPTDADAADPFTSATEVPVPSVSDPVAAEPLATSGTEDPSIQTA
jgi:hypothetical protein